MKRMRLFAVVMIFSALFMTGCERGKIRVTNVSSSQTIVLQSNGRRPHRIKITGRGRIEGVASIALMLEGKEYKVERLNGDVHFEWDHDWYHNKAILEYKHGSAKSGNVTIEYEFFYI